MAQNSRLHMFKMVALGDAAVGKTSCIMRFTENRFAEDYKATLGATFAVKNLTIDVKGEGEIPVKLVIWDLGGQPSFREVGRRYMAGAMMAFLVYDVTRPETFLNVVEWHKRFMETNPDSVVAIVANKIDLEDGLVPPEAGTMLERWLGVTHFQTSAKTGENINALFKELLELAIQKRREMNS